MFASVGWLAGCGPATLGIPDPGFEQTAPGVTPGGATGDGPPGPGTETSGAAPDYRAPGPYEVASDGATFGASCPMRYDAWWPEGREAAALVVLAHGLERGRAQMAGHAEHFASWGLAVVAPDLCAGDLWSADHDRNARDLADLAEALADGRPVIHAGHSAGGLAAFLAAADDPLAVGHLGLDLVDWDERALDRADGLAVPAFGLLGEPSFCNEEGNAEGVYAAAPEGRMLRVEGADHCDFEDPTDVWCTSVCGGGRGDPEVVAGAITGLATAALLWASGDDPRAEQWWTPGTVPWNLLGDAISVP